jgi:hypothetical protein
MPGFAMGFAVLFMMAGGFVWGREGLLWRANGHWSSISVNDGYAFLLRRRLHIGDGAINDTVVWLANADLGLVLIIIGIAIYILAARANAK